MFGLPNDFMGNNSLGEVILNPCPICGKIISEKEKVAISVSKGLLGSLKRFSGNACSQKCAMRLLNELRGEKEEIKTISDKKDIALLKANLSRRSWLIKQSSMLKDLMASIHKEMFSKGILFSACQDNITLLWIKIKSKVDIGFPELYSYSVCTNGKNFQPEYAKRYIEAITRKSKIDRELNSLDLYLTSGKAIKYTKVCVAHTTCY
jgi:endogenous inhibitor of DNA gyrase (YacG/DUF329 family)